MVFYGEFVPDSHIVVVIDEEYEDPGEIPEHFLQREENTQPDWFPTRSTTMGPEIQISVVNATDHLDVTASPFIDSSSVALIPKTTTKIGDQTTMATNGFIGNPEKFLNIQFFSDVDGANK